jgi:hypothetical protein
MRPSQSAQKILLSNFSPHALPFFLTFYCEHLRHIVHHF